MKFVQPIRDPDKLEEVKGRLKDSSDRNYLMFIIGINTGLRISDILKLKVKDVRDQDHINLVEMKTNKAKRIIITPALRRELKPYIQNKDDDEYLIKSRQGGNKPLTREMVYLILNQIAKEAGLKEIGTHTMRKTFGYHFYLKYKDVALLQDIYNHSDPKTTLRYIGINDDMKDKAIYNFKI